MISMHAPMPGAKSALADEAMTPARDPVCRLTEGAAHSPLGSYAYIMRICAKLDPHVSRRRCRRTCAGRGGLRSDEPLRSGAEEGEGAAYSPHYQYERQACLPHFEVAAFRSA